MDERLRSTAGAVDDTPSPVPIGVDTAEGVANGLVAHPDEPGRDQPTAR
ncbi:MAG: hypothetical protein ACOC42_01880 [Halobacteriota archaeon]